MAKHKQVKELLALKSSFEKETFEETLDLLNDEKFVLLEEHLSSVASNINLKAFQFNLTTFDKGGKAIYTFNKDAASFYASKQLQINISKTFKVKQSSRHDIIKQLKTLLDNPFPKYVIRTDIKSFYESISQVNLLRKIDENQLLNYKSKKLIKSLIWHYEDVKDKDIYRPGHGVPRGVGVSAYLTELYMRDVDRALMNTEDVIYYARYVDDIIIIFMPPSKVKIKSYLTIIKSILNDHDLEIKDGSDGEVNKTFTLDFFDPIPTYQFDLLGYKFIIENSLFKELKMSDNKVAKYNNRLDKIVAEYNLYSKYNERSARRLMFKRLKFLTGNFHLINSKKNIKSGIFYSNVLLNDSPTSAVNDITHLNNLLKRHISKISLHAGLTVDIVKLKAQIIKKFNFADGFIGKKRIRKGVTTTERTFYSFSKTDFIEITSCWK